MILNPNDQKVPFALRFMQLIGEGMWSAWTKAFPFQNAHSSEEKMLFWEAHKDKEPWASFFSEAFSVFLADRMTSFTRGVAAYQRFPRSSPSLPKEIWRRGASSLRYIPVTTTQTRAAVLFLPAFINNPDIFTFPCGGLCNFLTQMGVVSYLLDWGEVCCSSVEEYFEEVLFPAVQALKQHEAVPLFLFGYCIGAVPVLGLLSHPEGFSDLPIAGAILLAPAWDLRVYPPATQQFIDSAFALYKQGPAPERTEPIVTTCFLNFLQPWAIFEKYARFTQYEDEEKRRTFVKTEDWLNDVYALSTPFVQNTLSSWFLENSLCTERWLLFKRPLLPKKIQIPMLLAAPSKDRVVPPASGRTLSKSLLNCTFISPPVGHIGALVGHQAKEIFWRPCLNFMLDCLER
jgi:polyhydroxyalkanoate synthase